VLHIAEEFTGEPIPRVAASKVIEREGQVWDLLVRDLDLKTVGRLVLGSIPPRGVQEASVEELLLKAMGIEEASKDVLRRRLREYTEAMAPMCRLPLSDCERAERKYVDGLVRSYWPQLQVLIPD
jgi:hypothetical protein